MHNLSSQTRTFVIILFFACASAYAALAINSRLNWLTLPQVEQLTQTDKPKEEAFNENIQANSNIEQEAVELLKAEDPEALKPENWENYESNTYNLNFRYPRTWLVSMKTLDEDFDVVEIQPANGQTIKIYISSSDYFALDGFDTETAKVGNKNGFTIDNLIYGVRVGSTYYTFDSTDNSAMNEQFIEIVASAKL